MTTSSLPEFDGPRALRRAIGNWRLLFLISFAILTVGTHLPNANLQAVGPVLPDKLFHFVGFGILALLLWRTRLLPLAWMPPVAVAVWIPLDEWTQGLVGSGRTVATDDMIAGWMGVTAATVMIFTLSPWGPTPLQITRQRLLLSLDLVAARARHALPLILLPVIVCVGGFFGAMVLLRLTFPPAEILGSAPGVQYPQWAFVMAMALGIVLGLLLLRRILTGVRAIMDGHRLCFFCGTPPRRPVDPDVVQDACCSCGQRTFPVQWSGPGLLARTGGLPVVIGCFTGLATTFASVMLLSILFDDVSLNFRALPTDPTGFVRFAFFRTLTMTSLLLSGVVGLCVGVSMISALRSRVVMKRGWFCSACGFDLRRTRENAGVRTCPECGLVGINWQAHRDASPSSFERNTRTVMSMTAISRLTGLVREGILSRIFGTDAILSSFYFAFLVPNLFRRLFGEGALAAAFLPAYEQLNRTDPDTARRLAAATLGAVLLVVGAIVVVAELVLLWINVGSLESGNLAIWLMMIMLPYAPLVCMVALLGAMLQVHGRFGPTAAAPIILNVCIVIAAATGFALAPLGSDPQATASTVLLMAGGVLVAGLVQITWSVFALSADTRLPWSTSGVQHHLRGVFRKAGPMILGLGVLQVNTLIDGLIASYRNYAGTSTFMGTTWPLDEHAMAVLTFAQRLYQFPLGVFGIAVATAIYPLLATQAGRRLDFSDTVRRGIRLVLFIGVPASFGLMAVATPLTGAILQGGFFSEADTGRVAFVLLGYASCVWAYSLIQVMTRAFYAAGDTMTPVKIAVSVVGLNLVLNLVLIWTPLREAGLAWSTAICATLQCIILLRLLRRHVDHPLDRPVLGSIGRTVGLTVIMAAALAAVQTILPAGNAWIDQVRNLAIFVVLGSILFSGGAAMLRMPELRWALGGRQIPRTKS